MSEHARYAGRTVALLTQHGKERVIAPVLEPALGCKIERIGGFDTDQFGSFIRETPRAGTQLEAARRKARKGMELSGASLGIASEGSFGPDPYAGMFPWNVEMLLWIDDELRIEVTGIAQGAARSGHCLCSDWQAVVDFAEQEGFPAQQLVLRPEGPDDARIHKDIADLPRLRAAFDACRAQSSRSQVFVETDLRAFANPGRLRYIEQAAADLLRRLQSGCPACHAPGFAVSEWLPGLPCAECHAPTSSYLYEIWTCARCEHRAKLPRRDRTEADPAHCEHCNP